MSAAPKLAEKDFIRYVTEVAQRFQWKVWHVPAPMRATSKGFVGAKEAAGLPDLVMISDDPPRLVFAELKGTGGKLSVEQQEFLQAAQKVADDVREEYGMTTDADLRRDPVLGVYAWQPGQEDQIETILKTRVLL